MFSETFVIVCKVIHVEAIKGKSSSKNFSDKKIEKAIAIWGWSRNMRGGS